MRKKRGKALELHEAHYTKPIEKNDNMAS